MKRRTNRRRTNRIAALRIDVGIIILPQLGVEAFRTELTGIGVTPETINRVLSPLEKRRPVMPERATARERNDRRYQVRPT